MNTIAGLILTMISLMGLGVLAWHLDRRECEERLLGEALETSRLLDESLEQRLQEIDQYRHDLAALLQRLGLEEVRTAEEWASESQ